MKKTLKITFNKLNDLFDLILPRENIDKEKLIKEIKISKSYSPFGHINIFQYKNLTKKALWLVKFKNDRKTAALFSEILNDILLEEIHNLEIMHNFKNPVLVKVPSSTKSIKERGYDHNELFLKNIKNSSYVQYEKKLISKIKNTKRQSHFKNKKDREENIKNSFLIKNQKMVSSRNIILFDDIITSSATINECKKILKNAGAKKILVLTLAH